MNKIQKPKPKIEKPVKNNTDGEKSENGSNSSSTSDESSTKKEDSESPDGSATDTADTEADAHDEL